MKKHPPTSSNLKMIPQKTTHHVGSCNEHFYSKISVANVHPVMPVMAFQDQQGLLIMCRLPGTATYHW